MNPIVSPLIALIDVLLLLILSMISEQAPNIKIALPYEKPIKDTLIVSWQKGRTEYYFDTEQKQWSPIAKLANYSFIIGNIPCTTKKCQDTPSPPAGEKRIYLKGDLQREVSDLISDACLAFPKECTQTKLYVTLDSHVDMQRLKNEYKFFQNIVR